MTSNGVLPFTPTAAPGTSRLYRGGGVVRREGSGPELLRVDAAESHGGVDAMEDGAGRGGQAADGDVVGAEVLHENPVGGLHLGLHPRDQVVEGVRAGALDVAADEADVPDRLT